jgi:hypothetical protein
MTFRHAWQLGLWVLILGSTLMAQPSPQRPQAPGAVTTPDNLKNLLAAQQLQALNSDAREVREELGGLFQQYPPSLQQVLQLDPSLLSNANYLATYPSLASFIAQHPEIAHNPAYFVGTRENNRNYQPSIGESIERILEPLMVGTVVITLICILGWIIRSIMNHRRWLRVSKLQTDMQNKLLERFTSNEEMLAFIQTSAGQRFLESASMIAEPGPRALSAPVGRMLWSIQLGIVILVAGVGLVIVSHQLNYEDAVIGFEVAGGIVIALGVGFMLSALGSYLLSRRLGLLEPAPSPAPK